MLHIFYGVHFVKAIICVYSLHLQHLILSLFVLALDPDLDLLLLALLSFLPLLLYNILLAINWYIGTITKNVIAKSINRIGIPHGYFSDLLDISIPHEYADVSY